MVATGFAMLKPENRGTCKLADCEKFRYQDPSNGRIHEYCSRSHAFLAKETGMKIHLFDCLGLSQGLSLGLSLSNTQLFQLFVIGQLVDEPTIINISGSL